MQGKTAEEVLETLIDVIETGCDELNAPRIKYFGLGVKSAYVECLEYIQEWEKAKEYGLDYEIEDRYPIDGRVTIIK